MHAAIRHSAIVTEKFQKRLPTYEDNK